MESDPEEWKNLAASPEYEEIKKKLYQSLPEYVDVSDEGFKDTALPQGK